MRTSHRARLPILLALACACAPAPAAPSAERAVLDAVLANVDAAEGAAGVAVAPRTATMSPEWFPEIGAHGSGPEAALWHRLAERSADVREAHSLALPSRAWVLSPVLADAFEAHDATWMATLARARLRLSGSAGVVSLSPVAFSRDSTSALVYYEYRCGSLCGRGAVAWLIRQRGGSWKVQGRQPIWVR
jgi:hypothetical protein